MRNTSPTSTPKTDTPGPPSSFQNSLVFMLKLRLLLPKWFENT